MSRVLVLYGTTEGQTAKIATAIAGTLCDQGIEVTVVEAGTADPRAGDYAGVIVAASVHGGRYQRAVQRWVHNNRRALMGKPSAFVSVCLAVLQWQPEVQRELNAIIDRFLMATGWRPTWTKPVAGALVYTKYGWLKRWIMRRIAAKAGGDTDTTRDHEYTDWEDLRTFAKRFALLVAQADRQGKGTAPSAHAA